MGAQDPATAEISHKKTVTCINTKIQFHNYTQSSSSSSITFVDFSFFPQVYAWFVSLLHSVSSQF